MSTLIVGGLLGPRLVAGGLLSGVATGNTLIVGGLLGPRLVAGGLGGSSSRDIPLSVAVGLGLSPSASIAYPRHRLGERIDLSYTLGSTPDAPFSATVTGPAPSGDVVAVLPMWTRDGSTFRASFVADRRFATGTFFVEANPSISGQPAGFGGGLEIVPGGDPHGSIVAMHAHEGFAGRSVVVQTSDGSLLAGRDPWV